MRVSLLSIGDEVVFGEIVDTNAPFIAEKLYSLGEKTRLHLSVGDVEQEIVDALTLLAGTSDSVIATGGLGPTIDDVTAKAAAAAVGVPLLLHEAALEHVTDVTCKLGGDLAHNEKQAFLPEGAAIIPNPVGTACGFRLEWRGCTLYFLPGVPAEMKRMLNDTVLPSIAGRRPHRTVLLTKVLKVFGIAEAELDPLLEDLAVPATGISVAYAVQFPQILVKLRAEGDDERLVRVRLDEATDRARTILRDFLFAEDSETIDTEVAALLRRTGATLSLAESCTGGLVAKRITDLAGSSAYFLEGAVTYSNEAKMRALGVPDAVLAGHGAVSAETAVAMARGMRERSGSAISISITGIAGPDGGSLEKPVGTVYIGVATRDGCRAHRYNFNGSRKEIRSITAFAALDLLRRHLITLV